MNYLSGDFLKKLYEIEQVLPSLLDDTERWESLFVNYSQPFVERVYRNYDGLRICLHRIQNCMEGSSLFHPHPWPSAMRIIEGSYEMGIGYGTTDQMPPVAALLTLPATSAYEMIDPNGWHWVRPITPFSLSLMVTGTPWNRTSPKSSQLLSPLDSAIKKEILESFKKIYK
jgi:hypothetical protein